MLSAAALVSETTNQQPEHNPKTAMYGNPTLI